MQPEQYARMRAEEERHWWYRGNRAVVAALLGSVRGAVIGRHLDVGCGTGQNLESLARTTGSRSVGLDFAPAALAHCRARGLHRLVQGSVMQLPFRPQSFDLVTCFEVLYHREIGDWRTAIAGLAAVLRPGGILLLREPAFGFLAGDHDVVVQGARRFRRAEVRAAVRATGLEILRLSYQNVITFLPAAVLRTWQRCRRGPRPPAPDFATGGGRLQVTLERLLSWEGWWLRHAVLPFGSSVLCLARKPGATHVQDVHTCVVSVPSGDSGPRPKS